MADKCDAGGDSNARNIGRPVLSRVPHFREASEEAEQFGASASPTVFAVVVMKTSLSFFISLCFFLFDLFHQHFPPWCYYCY